VHRPASLRYFGASELHGFELRDVDLYSERIRIWHGKGRRVWWALSDSNRRPAD